MLAFYICLADEKWRNTLMPDKVSLQIKTIGPEHFGTFTCRLTKGTDQTIIASVSYRLIEVDGRNTNKNVLLILLIFIFLAGVFYIIYKLCVMYCKHFLHACPTTCHSTL